jgi:hypothetical protein
VRHRRPHCRTRPVEQREAGNSARGWNEIEAPRMRNEGTAAPHARSRRRRARICSQANWVRSLGEWHSARRTCPAARAALPSPPVAAARAGPGKAADSARAPALRLSQTLYPLAPLSLLVLAQEQSLTSGRRQAVRRRNIARGRDEREESEKIHGSGR